MERKQKMSLAEEAVEEQTKIDVLSEEIHMPQELIDSYLTREKNIHYAGVQRWAMEEGIWSPISSKTISTHIRKAFDDLKAENAELRRRLDE